MSKTLNNRVTRYNFSVPVCDTQVTDWIEAQHNISNSIRLLIKCYAAMKGITDISCQPDIVIPGVFNSMDLSQLSRCEKIPVQNSISAQEAQELAPSVPKAEPPAQHVSEEIHTETATSDDFTQPAPVQPVAAPAIDRKATPDDFIQPAPVQPAATPTMDRKASDMLKSLLN